MEEFDIKIANLETHQAWDENAANWYEYMGEGNDSWKLCVGLL